METGLGGRLDATNLAKRSIAVITPISLEHTHILGNTLREIAREKSGIVKKDSISISAPQNKEALDVIKDACLRNRSTLYLVGRDICIDKGRFNRDVQSFNVWTKFGEYPLLELKLRGAHQIINAATAIGAVEALRTYSLFVPQDAVRRGISRAEWPGRMEVLRDNPLVIADGAQNDESSQALINAVKRHFEFNRLILVLGISKDKDIENICKILSRIADSIIATCADNPRAADPQILKRHIKDRPCRVFLNSKDAMDCAYSQAGKDDLILVTGSLFLVGEVKTLKSDFNQFCLRGTS